MKAPKIITILFVYVLLFTATHKNYAQNYACPGSTMSYGIGYYSGNDGTCSRLINSTPGVSGGQLISWDLQTVTVKWDNNFTSGTISCSFTIMGPNPSPTCYTYGSCSVSRIWATSMIISGPNPAMLGGHTYTLSSNPTHEGTYVNGSPSVTWKMYAGATPSESNFITQLNNSGGSISFRPYDYMQAIQNYFSPGNPAAFNYSDPATVYIQATYTVCGRSILSNNVLPVDIQPEPVTNILHTESPTTCLNSTDGKLEITQFVLDGVTYNSSNPNIPGNGVWLRVSAVNAQGGVIGNPRFDAAVTGFPIVVGGLEDISGIGASYQFQIERIFTGGIASGIFDQDHPFSITKGPQLLLHLDKTSPDCYTSGLTATASVLDQNGTQVLGGFDYYLNTNVPGLNVNTYTYGIPNAGTYNLQAVSKINSNCKTDIVPFTNPYPISIVNIDESGTDNSFKTNPKTCVPPDGKISIQAINGQVGGTATFELFRVNGTQQISLEVSGSISTVANCTTEFADYPSGIYRIIVTDGCTQSSTSTDIVLDPLPIPVITSANDEMALCNGGQGNIILNSFSFLTNNYSNGSISGVTDYSVRLQSGSAIIDFDDMDNLPYTAESEYFTGGSSWDLVVVRNETGCPSLPWNISIAQPDPLTVIKNQSSAICEEDSIVLSANVLGGVGPYTYFWKDQDNSDLTEKTSSLKVWEGLYQLGIVDGNNCGLGKIVPDGSTFFEKFIATRPQSLDVYVELIVDADSVGKANGSVSLGTLYNESPVEYSSDGINYKTTPLFSGLAAGIYKFYIRNENSCLDSIEVEVGEAHPFSASLKYINEVVCYGESTGEISITANGGIKPYTFEITGINNSIHYSQGDSIFKGLPYGIYDVKVSYTGINTYSSTIKNVAIHQPDAPLQVDITGHGDAVCGEISGWATALGSGGTTPYSYQWGETSNWQTSQTAQNLIAATHIITITDSKNCLASTSIDLFDPKGPILTQSGSTPAPCSNSTSGGSASLSVTGGEPPYTYSWKGLDISGPIATDIGPGTYTVTVTDNTGCPFTLNTIIVPSPDELIVRFDDFSDPACFNDSNGKIIASGDGGTEPYTFNWQNAVGEGSTITDLPAGNYFLQIIDAHNCSASAGFELKNPDEIIVNLPDSIFVCEGQTATLDAGNMGSLYQWSSPNGFSSVNQIVNVQDQGDYSVVVSNANGCSNSGKVYVKHENRMFYATFLMASEATMNDTIILVELSRPIPDSLEWYISGDFIRLTDGEAYKELIPLQTGQYTIGMKGYLSGCSDIVEKTITIIPAKNQDNLKSSSKLLIQSVKLYPNPNSGVFQIEVKLAYEANICADLFNAYGRRILPTTYDYGNKDYVLDFNLMNLEPGIYFVNIIAENEIRKLKFIVSK